MCFHGHAAAHEPTIKIQTEKTSFSGEINYTSLSVCQRNLGLANVKRLPPNRKHSVHHFYYNCPVVEELVEAFSRNLTKALLTTLPQTPLQHTPEYCGKPSENSGGCYNCKGAITPNCLDSQQLKLVQVIGVHILLTI